MSQIFVYDNNVGHVFRIQGNFLILEQCFERESEGQTIVRANISWHLFVNKNVVLSWNFQGIYNGQTYPSAHYHMNECPWWEWHPIFCLSYWQSTKWMHYSSAHEHYISDCQGYSQHCEGFVNMSALTDCCEDANWKGIWLHCVGCFHHSNIDAIFGCEVVITNLGIRMTKVAHFHLCYFLFHSIGQLFVVFSKTSDIQYAVK